MGIRGILALAALAALTSAAAAADFNEDSGPPLRGGFHAEFGTRAWLGFGSTGKSLRYPGTAVLLSRLTYGGMPTASGEVFGKATAQRFFLSAYGALGTAPGGTLKDEDFPPFTSPYSSTESGLQNGGLSYAAVDLGYNYFDSPDGSLGVFAGYTYLHQQMNGFGCTQTGTNPGICVPAISDSTAVISQDNSWQGMRVGVSGDMRIGDHWRLNGDGAILPHVVLNGADTHWLRIPSDFTGPVPDDGTGWGLQIQGMLDYQVNDALSVGLGGRYWHMQTSGNSHFEGHVTGGGGFPEPVDWSTDLIGALAEVKAQF